MSGRASCAWCWRDLGPRPGLPPGTVTHGICAGCADDVGAGLKGGQGRSVASLGRSARVLGWALAGAFVLALLTAPR